jgi:hypothetical protein
VRLLLYSTNAKSDTSARWDSNRPRDGVICALSLQIVRLDPAMSHTFYGEAMAGELQQAQVSAGKYQLIVEFLAAPALGPLNAGPVELKY